MFSDEITLIIVSLNNKGFYSHQLIIYEMLLHLMRQEPSQEHNPLFDYYRQSANEHYHRLKQPVITKSIFADQNAVELFHLTNERRRREYGIMQILLRSKKDELSRILYFLEGKEHSDLVFKISVLERVLQNVNEALHSVKFRPDKLIPDLANLPGVCGRKLLTAPLLEQINKEIRNIGNLQVPVTVSHNNLPHLETLLSIVLLSTTVNLASGQAISIDTLQHLLEACQYSNISFSMDKIHDKDFIEVCYAGIGRLTQVNRIVLTSHIVLSLLKLLEHPQNHLCLYSRKDQYLANPTQSSIAIQFGLFQMPWEEQAPRTAAVMNHLVLKK